MPLTENFAILNGCTEPKIKMPTPKKLNKTLKTPPSSPKSASKAPPSTRSQTAKKPEALFDKFKKHFEPEKVDEFQKKWLALPENRKKYQKITDAPQVAAEEIIAMTNDLINFVQGEKTGQSKLIQKIKTGLSGFFKNPAKFVQDKAEAVKDKAVDLKNTAQDKLKETASDVKDSTLEKVDQLKEKTQTVAKKQINKAATKIKATTDQAKTTVSKTTKKTIKASPFKTLSKSKKPANKPAGKK